MTISSGDSPQVTRRGPLAGQRVIAILGMHRSGTSLLAGTLQECGLELGDVNTHAPANEKGNRESWLLIALHEDLLRKAGGFWHRPPVRPVIWTRLHMAIRSLFIEEFAGVPLWGFKDPRLLHLLDGWLEVLPALETVGIFRHPREVADSLRERTPSLFPGDSAERLWLEHNRRLLAWHDRTGCPLLEFVPDRAAFNAAATAVARRLALPGAPPTAELSFYEERLRHQSADAEPLCGEVADVYAALRQRAAARDSA